MIKETYQRWLDYPQMDPVLKKELAEMNEQQIEDAFYTNLAFGTAGMRGLLGAGTNRMNIYTVGKANVGYGQYLCSLTPHPSVAIAYDNRFYSPEFARHSAEVLASMGIKCYLFTSLRPTPELSFAVRELKCTGGIVVTASHNPKEYNGYKVYDETGCQLTPEKIDLVIKNVEAVKDELAINPVLTEEQQKLIVPIDKEIDIPYLQQVLTVQLNPQLEKDNFSLVFTPQHGTANNSVKALFDTIGYHYIPVTEQCTPDPAFSNTVVPNPEDPRAYELAIRYAQKNNADIVLSTDPDADRVGVVVRDKTGHYTLMSGNQTGSVLLEYVFSQLTEKGKMPKNPVMFNTVVTSDLGEKIADHYGVATEKTLTGFKYIGAKIFGYEKTHQRNFVFGYEESYGYLLKPFVRDKDANQSCVIIAEAANFYKQQGKTLLDVLNELYAKYGTYQETQQSMSLPGEDGSAKLKQLLADLRAHVPSQLAGHMIVKYEDYGTRKQYQSGNVSDLTGFDISDVLKYYMDDGSWIAIRPSGTEPKCKFYYCIAGRDKNDAAMKTEEYYRAIADLTGNK